MRSSLWKTAFLSLVLWIAAAPILAASVWKPLGPYGGSVWSVVADPVRSGVLYAIVPAFGVFKSVDAGESWKPMAGISKDFVALAFDTTHPRVLYASSLWVHKSTDGGSTWALASQGLPAPFVTRVLTVDPANPARLYLGTLERGLWRSRDGGASWQAASLGLPNGGETRITAIAVPRRPSGTAFAGTDRGLYKTRDYGASWEALNLPGANVSSLTVAPSDPWTVYAALDSQGVARSTDGGVSWTTSLPWPLRGSINSLAVDPRSSRTLYAGTDSGLFKSTNAGRTWVPIGPDRSLFVAGVTLDPQAPDRVYAALYESGFEIGGVLRSTDAGRHWFRSSTGINCLSVGNAAVDAGDPGRLLVGVRSAGLFRTFSEGKRWARSPLVIPRESPTIAIESLAASPEIAGNFVTTASPGNHVWKTFDGGLTWTSYGDFRSLAAFVRFDPSRGDTFFLIDRNAIFRGTMTDSSLTFVSQRPLGCLIADLAMVRDSLSGPPVLYAAGAGLNAPQCATSTRSQVVRSTDGGVTWSSAGAGLPGMWVAGLLPDPENPDVLYARIGNDITGVFQGLWKTEDRGATWRLASEALRGRFVSAFAALPGRLFAAISEGPESKVLRSQDGGETWQEHGEGLPPMAVFQLMTTPAAPGRVYASTSLGLWMLEDEP